MMQVMPIIIPIQGTPDRCPECHEIENVIKVCAHCGHEYKDKGLPSIANKLLIYGMVGIVSLLLVLIWLSASALMLGYETFPEVVNHQWAWLKSLF